MIINSLNIPDGLKPIRVICLGSDTDPATAEDISKVQKYLVNHANLPKDWPKKTRRYKVHRSPLPGTFIVQIGSCNRPATPEDIEIVRKNLFVVANDPDLTIVTHHNFKMEWVGEGVVVALFGVSTEKSPVEGSPSPEEQK